jgi:hypothetical protein
LLVWRLGRTAIAVGRVLASAIPRGAREPQPQPSAIAYHDRSAHPQSEGPRARARGWEGEGETTRGEVLNRAADEAGRAVQYLLAPGQTYPRLPFAGAVPFLHLMACSSAPIC